MGPCLGYLCVDSEPEGQGAGEEAGITTGPIVQVLTEIWGHLSDHGIPFDS